MMMIATRAITISAGFNPFDTTAAGKQRHRRTQNAIIEREARGTVAASFEKAVGFQVALAAAAIERGDHDPPVAAMPLQEAYSAFYREVVPDVASHVFDIGQAAYEPVRALRKAGDVELSRWQQIIAEFLSNEGAVRMRLINDTTRRFIQSALSEGIEEKWGPIKTARELRKHWSGPEGISRYRAERIARTETLSALNKGASVGAQSVASRYGLEMEKEWIWSGISRETHAAVDGVRVAMNSFFTVDGEQMEHPGDASASARNVINCGCSHSFVVIE